MGEALDKGADVRAEYYVLDETVPKHAREKGRKKILELLKAHGARE